MKEASVIGFGSKPLLEVLVDIKYQGSSMTKADRYHRPNFVVAWLKRHRSLMTWNKMIARRLQIGLHPLAWRLPEASQLGSQKHERSRHLLLSFYPQSFTWCIWKI